MKGVKRILFGIGAAIALSIFATACYYPPRNGSVRLLHLSSAQGATSGSFAASPTRPAGSQLNKA